jgi:hypothetical protein
MTDWTPQDDWWQVKVGDTVRATRNDDAITYEVVDKYIAITGDAPYALVVRPVGLTWQTRLDRNVWSLSVPAKPAVVLPEEAGAYIDREGEIWELRDGEWNYGNSRKWPAHTAEFFAPFTKLEPITVTAKKVLDKVQRVAIINDHLVDGLQLSLDDLRKEFGVTE